MRGSLFSRNFAVVALAVVAAVALVLVASVAVTEGAYIRSNADTLKRAAQAAAAAAPESLLPEAASSPPGKGAAQEFCERLGAASGFRVTLVDVSGRVRGDTGADAAAMPNHQDRPEIAAALEGQASWSRRKSSTTGGWTLYAAAPIRGGMKSGPGSITGALRVALSLPGFLETLGAAKRLLALIALAAALLALAASAAFMRMLSRPIVHLSERARRYAAGGMETEGGDSRRRRGEGRSMPRELKVLETSLDAMAAELHKKAAEAEAQGKRFSSILDSAGEAIVALGPDLKVSEANPAAEAMFSASAGGLAGMTILQISGSPALASMAERCLASSETAAADVTLYSRSGETLHVNIAPLSGEKSGLVLSATDISAMKRLETMRTDFVANVSHELRTPIHLIRGFSETLRDDLAGKKGLDGTSGRYLEIIERNALRMERIVDDLLSLARLERVPGEWLTVELCMMDRICRSAVETVETQAKARSVAIEVEAPQDLRLVANPGLVEQAIGNLLENAVRYSPEGGLVRVEAALSGDFVEVRVRDHGPGIPAPALERIFERFYRVDKSRDRKSGGTGLGLAIVRHIAMAHGGSVSAESWTGEGSVFSLRLPVSGPRHSVPNPL